jgi:hypothetical protein
MQRKDRNFGRAVGREAHFRNMATMTGTARQEAAAMINLQAKLDLVREKIG